MRNAKKLIVAAGAAGVIGLGGISASAIAASNSDGASSYPPIVQKIAGKFGLDPAKVSDVFKQQRQEDMASHDAKLKTTLDQAVKDGKLTQDQETKLIAELKALHSQMKNDKSQNRQDFKTQLDKWAADNGITNLDQILPRPSHGGMHHMMANDGDADDSSADAANN